MQSPLVNRTPVEVKWIEDAVFSKGKNKQTVSDEQVVDFLSPAFSALADGKCSYEQTYIDLEQLKSVVGAKGKGIHQLSEQERNSLRLRVIGQLIKNHSAINNLDYENSHHISFFIDRTRGKLDSSIHKRIVKEMDELGFDEECLSVQFCDSSSNHWIQAVDVMVGCFSHYANGKGFFFKDDRRQNISRYIGQNLYHILGQRLRLTSQEALHSASTTFFKTPAFIDRIHNIKSASGGLGAPKFKSYSADVSL